MIKNMLNIPYIYKRPTLHENPIFFTNSELTIPAENIVKLREQQQKIIHQLTEQNGFLKQERDTYQYESTYDTQTGLLNLRGLMKHEKELFGKHEKVTAIFFDIKNLGMINNFISYEKGTDVINIITGILKDVFLVNDGITRHLGRIGGDEFVLVTGNQDLNDIIGKLQQVEQKIESYRNEHWDYTIIKFDIRSAYKNGIKENEYKKILNELHANVKSKKLMFHVRKNTILAIEAILRLLRRK